MVRVGYFSSAPCAGTNSNLGLNAQSSGPAFGEPPNATGRRPVLPSNPQSSLLWVADLWSDASPQSDSEERDPYSPGKVQVTVVPLPVRDCTSSLAPRTLARCRMMSSPIPR